MAFNWTQSQESIIKHRDGDILVAAGAGSGKTAVLTQHIINRVLYDEKPVDIDRLLVLTFTKAAASEMKERIRKGIEKALAEAGDDVNISSRARRQLSLINSASISTIDSFCQKVLREQFFKVNLDPGFSVADETEMKLLKNDLLNELIEKKYEEKDSEFLSLADKYGRVKGDDELLTVVNAILNQAVGAPDPEKWFEEQIGNRSTEWVGLTLERGLKTFKGLVEQYRKLYDFSVAEKFPEALKENLKKDLAQMDSALEKSSEYTIEDFSGAISGIKFDRKASKPKKDVPEEWLNPNIDMAFDVWRDKLKKKFGALANLYGGCSEGLIELEESEMGDTIDALIKLTREYYQLYQQAKAKENQVDFNDMEQLVWKLFYEDGNRTETALEYESRFDEIMVDEYQDCNQIQEDILNAMANEQTPNRFMVGDVKQSIYGFRGGKPDIFIAKQKAYREGGDALHTLIELRENFRSTVGVLEGINEIFARIMTEESSGINYSEYERLKPDEALNPEKGPDIEIMIADTTELKEGQTGASAEAEMVAAKIYDLVEGENKIQVIDRETKKLRPVEYGDVAILLRSASTHAEEYIRALKERGISAYSESEKGYYTSLEVNETLSFLSILDNPYQDVEMLGVLRSGYVNLTTDELATIRLVGIAFEKKWLYEAVRAVVEENDGEVAVSKELETKLEAFLKTYDYFREKSAIAPISELLGELTDITGYSMYVLALPGGKKRVQNLYMLRVKAREYEQTRYRGIFKFLRYIEQLKSYELDISTPSISDRSSVVLMTIHKSKGLEFPICFVCNASSEFSRLDYTGKVIHDEKFGIVTDIIDSELGYKMVPYKKKCVKEHKKITQKTEEQRLLYVALTRAKDRLIITGHKSKTSEWLSSLKNRIDEKLDVLPAEQVFDSSNYLDWIVMAVMHMEISGRESGHSSLVDNGRLYLETGRTRISASVLKAADAETMPQTENIRVEVQTAPIPDELKKAIDRKYPFEAERGIHSIYTVSELKKTHYEDEEDKPELFGIADKKVSADSNTVSDSDILSGSDRGNAYHHVAEHISFAAFDGVTGEALKELVSKSITELAACGKITGPEAKTVKTEDYAKLFASAIGSRMIAADLKNNLYKEQDFIYAAYPQEISELHFTGESDEHVLIQGIIDAVFKEDDKWILVDYKTDRVSYKDGADELIARYSAQLDYYKKAWEDITGEPVSEMYLYSFQLGRFVPYNPE